MDDLGRNPAHQTATILVIEDDPDISAIVVEILRDEGFRVVASDRHLDALDLLADRRFALILSDSAGRSVVTNDQRWADLDAVRRAAVGSPTIIFTAHTPSAFDGYAERGFAGLIAKPCNLDELLATVRHNLS